MASLPSMPWARGDMRTGVNTLGRELLLRRIAALTPLSPAEVALILSITEKPKLHAPGTTICPKSDGSPHPRLIVSGWACRPRILADGRRQMLAVLLPGDVLGDRGDRRPLALNPAVALTPVRTVGVAQLFEAASLMEPGFGGLADAMTELGRLEETRALDQIVRLGCQNAVQRTAHCFLEFYSRFREIGLTHGHSFPMPLTQETLGDFLGLSLVHMNRILTQLRRDRLAEVRDGAVIVHDFARLALLADLPDPTRVDRPN